MLNPNTKKINLLEEECTLYAKHLTLDNIGLNGQKRLKKAKVLVIGAGGLGCPAMLYLAAAGIGYIGIIDNDNIDISNLNRQILYSFNNLNQDKLICAKNKLNSINPYCKIILHSYKIKQENAFEVIQYYDIIIDACDNFDTRYIIDKYCYSLHKVHIYGAIQQFESQINVFNYKNSICYSNIYPFNIHLLNNNCENYGVIGSITGHIGILQTTEAIKIVLSIGKIIYNKLIIFNLLYIYTKDTSIYLSKRQKISIKVNKTDNKLRFFIPQLKYKHLKGKFYHNYLIVDIRQEYEFRKNHLPYSVNITLNKFKNKKTILFLKYTNRKKIMIYCHTTYRSLIVSNILNKYKIKYSIVKYNY
uniref:Molybdopterin biosynthesis protein n=1 Tax=Cumathamnion serrulatum TaxID=1206573 RepID=A0A7U1AQZ0_9FLOR|nr:Molybdopterin biosynthesis protein [Cumathamnion serrulatum]QQY85273.1 Molybdopterin biosynthesis protein [Cumathamnion serrulatum]